MDPSRAISGVKTLKIPREDTQNFRNPTHFANDRVRFYGKVP